MEFRLTIELTDGHKLSGAEVSNILADLAHDLMFTSDTNQGIPVEHWDAFDRKGNLREANGKIIGAWSVTL